MLFELKVDYFIESARFLPNLAKTHPCASTHGHSFKIRLLIIGPLKQPEGWVIDYNEVNLLMAPLLSQIDHKMLNEVPGLENPTSENLAYWIYEKARNVIPGLRQVTIAETPKTECSYPVLGLS